MPQSFIDETTSPAPASVTEGILAVKQEPSSAKLWDELESAAQEHDCPEWVAKSYVECIEGLAQTQKTVPRSLMERALNYVRDWFGTVPEQQAGLLYALASVDPLYGELFDEATVTLTHLQQWDALLTLHDRRAEQCSDPQKRWATLEQAAQISIDFGHDASRAMGYYAALLELRPRDNRVFNQLSRVVEKEAAWPLFVETLAKRAPHLSSADARSMWLQRADLLLDKLDRSEEALMQYKALLAEEPPCEKALQALQAIAQSPSYSTTVRRQAGQIKLEHFRKISDLRAALETVDRMIALYESKPELELVHTRLDILFDLDDHDAISRYSAQTLLIHPQDPKASDALRQRLNTTSTQSVAATAVLEVAKDNPKCEDTLFCEFALDATSRLEDSKKDYELSATVLRQLIQNENIDQRHQQDAVSRFLSLPDDIRRSFEDAELLRAQIERCDDPQEKVQLYERLAKILDPNGMNDEVQDVWRKILEINKTHAPSQEYIAKRLRQDQAYGQLVNHLQRCIESSQDLEKSLEWNLEIVEIDLQNRNQIDDGAQRLARMVTDYPKNTELQQQYCQTLEKFGRWGELCSWLEPRAFAQRDAETIIRAGQIHLHHLDNAESARKCAFEALSIEPNYKEAHTLALEVLQKSSAEPCRPLALALWNARRASEEHLPLAETLDIASNAIGDSELEASLWLQASKVHHFRDEHDEALRSAICALRRDSGQPGLHEQVYQLAQRDSDSASALYCAIHDVAIDRFAENARLARLWDLAANIAQHEQPESQAQRNERLAAMAALATDPTTPRQQRALKLAVAQKEYNDLATVILQAQGNGSPEPKDLWKRICGSENADLSNIPYPLVEALERGLCQEPGVEDAAKRNWIFAVAQCLHAHGYHERARELAWTVVASYPERLSLAQKRLVFSWLLQTPERSADALSLVRRIDSNAELSVQERKAHLDLESRLEPSVSPQVAIALWNRCHRAFSTCERDIEKEALYSGFQAALLALIGFHTKNDSINLALPLVEQTLDLDISRAQYEQFFDSVWSALKLARSFEKAQNNQRQHSVMLRLLRVDSRRLREFDASYYEVSTYWRAQLLNTLLRRKKKLSERTALLTLLLEQRRELRSFDPELQDKVLSVTELRIELSDTLREQEHDEGHLNLLLDNLSEEPGNEDSLGRAVTILQKRAQFGRLAQLLADQAQELQPRESYKDRAAQLWRESALCFRDQAHSPQKARHSFTQALALDPRPDTLDSLVEIDLRDDEEADPVRASRWLARRLEMAKPEESLSILYQLCNLYLETKQNGPCIELLNTYIDRTAHLPEFRSLYLQAVDRGESQAAKVRARVRLTAHWSEAELIDETHQILAMLPKMSPTTLESIDLLPLFNRVAPLCKNDLTLQQRYVDALCLAEKPEIAQEHLESLIASHGRRRSSTLASLHAQLARLADRFDKPEVAANHYEQAALMNPEYAYFWVDVARLRQDLEDRSGAERAFRTLLLQAKKNKKRNPKLPAEPWVWLNMYLLADLGNDRDTAGRHWEACVDGCLQDTHAAYEVLATLAENPDHIQKYEELSSKLIEKSVAPELKAQLFAQKARHLHENQQSRAAADWIAQAIEIDSSNPQHNEIALQVAQEEKLAKNLVHRLDTLAKNKGTPGSDDVVARARYVALHCLLGQLCARVSGYQDQIEEHFAKATEVALRPQLILRARLEVATLLDNHEAMSKCIQQLHAEGLAPEATIGETWLARAQSAALRPRGYRAALFAVEQALQANASAEQALRCLLEMPEHREDPLWIELLARAESLARKLDHSDGLFSLYQRRMANRLVPVQQLEECYTLAVRHGAASFGDEVLDFALQDIKKNPKHTAQSVWAIFAYLDRNMNADTPCDDEIWDWVQKALNVTDEERLRPRLSTLLDRCSSENSEEHSVAAPPQALLERLLERAPTKRLYREALWRNHVKNRNDEELVTLAKRSLALMLSPVDRNHLRMRLVEYSIQNDSIPKHRMEFLRDVLQEDPAHGKAQQLLIEQYRDADELSALEKMLEDQLSKARAEDNRSAIARSGAALARIYNVTSPERALQFVHELLTNELPDDLDLARLALSWMPKQDVEEDANREQDNYAQDFRLHLCLKLVELGPAKDNAQYALMATEILMARQASDRAVEVLLQASRANPEHQGLREALLSCFEANERYADLVDLLNERALEQTGDTQKGTYIDIARLQFERLQDPQAALATLSKLEDRDALEGEEHEEVFALEIACLEQIHGPQAALDRLSELLPTLEDVLDLSRSITLSEDSEDKHTLAKEGIQRPALEAKRAVFLTRLERYADAIAIYSILVVLDSETHRDKLLELQRKYIEHAHGQGQSDKALASWLDSTRGYLQCDELTPEDEPCVRGLCELGERLGSDGERSADFLKSLSSLAITLKDGELTAKCQDWALECEDLEVAAQALDAVVTRTIANEQPAEALAYLERFERCHENALEAPSAEAVFRRVYESQDDYAGLGSLEKQLAKLKPDSKEKALHYKQAVQWYQQAQDFASMQAVLRQAVEHAPEDLELVLMLVDLDIEQGEHARAEARVDDTLANVRLNKSTASIICQLQHRKAWFCQQRGDLAGMLEWLTKSHQSDKEDIEIAMALIEQAESQEEWDLASRVLRHLGSNPPPEGAPPQSELCVRQARLWKNAGDLRKASFWAHKARHADPNSDEIRVLLEELAAAQRQAS